MTEAKGEVVRGVGVAVREGPRPPGVVGGTGGAGGGAAGTRVARCCRPVSMAARARGGVAVGGEGAGQNPATPNPPPIITAHGVENAPPPLLARQPCRARGMLRWVAVGRRPPPAYQRYARSPAPAVPACLFAMRNG